MGQRARRYATAAAIVGAALLSASCETITTTPVDDGPTRTDPGTPPLDHRPRDPFVAIDAPDETTIRLGLNWVPEGAEDPSHYTVTSDWGDLEVLEITVDDDATLWLTTSPQKLGVHYRLRFDGGLSGDAYRQDHTFPSADTTKLWATAIGAPDVGQMELTAKRVAIGERAVIYTEVGTDVANAEEVLAFFDEHIYPTETQLFNDAPDRDGNGRILLFGVDGASSFGGYFSVVNASTDEEAMEKWGRHSNEMEMLYVNVASGVMNADVVIAHEFAHLLYQETHDPTENWAYQNEGLAECAVHAVNGGHPKALNHYQADPTWTIRDGLSLVQWQSGNYPQYVQAYVFWSYVASQLGGVAGYGELFALTGHPNDVDAFLYDKLGVRFDEAQLNALIATWLQAPSGVRGFNNMLHFEKRPHVATTNSLSLQPFAGAFLVPSDTSMSYSGDQGPDVVYVGIDGEGTVDLIPPFDVDGGILVALNTALAFDDLEPQPTGLMPFDEGAPAEPSGSAMRDPSWLHPPPFDPRHLERTLAWQRRTAVVR